MTSTVKFDFSKLQMFVKSIDDKHQVQVGIFGNHNSRNEAGKFNRKMGHRRKTKELSSMTNAEIGATHEFGSFSRGIKMRSFLRMPISLRAKEILAETAIGAKELLAQGKIIMLLRRVGIACENQIQLAFATRGFGQWYPNRLSTVERKGSSEPLIDTAQLRRSIDSRVATI